MIHHGDLFDVLPTLEANSIDACVTDPPYGIGFMGKEWDSFSPGVVKTEFELRQRKEFKDGVTSANIKGRKRSPAASPSQIQYDMTTVGLRGFQDWTAKWAIEVHRVLKPGAYLVVCGAPRSHHRMMCGLEDAGFVVRDCFAWLFGSGFPKNKNLGDGRGTALKPAHEPIALAWKPFKGSISANVEKHGTGALNIDACRIEGAKPDTTRGAGGQHGRLGEIGAQGRIVDDGFGRWPANVLLDEEAAVLLDEQTGELTSGSYTGDRAPDGSRNAFGVFGGTSSIGGFPHEGSVGGASRFYKVVGNDCILCDSSRVSPAIMNECETTSASSAERRSRTIRRTIDASALNPAHVSLLESIVQAAPSVESLCATCVTSIALALVETRCSGSPQQALRAFPVSIPRSRSSILIPSLASFAALWVSIDIIPTTRSLTMLFGSVCHAIESSTRSASRSGDSDPQRFRYSAKPSREERDYGCFDLAERSGGEATDRKDGSAGLNNQRAGAGRTGGARNFHPTVKPVELMRWLVRLVTPPNGTVLDPFTGSGTTGMACRYELREFIGIEREAEYLQIAERRIAAVAPLFGERTA